MNSQTYSIKRQGAANAVLDPFGADTAFARPAADAIRNRLGYIPALENDFQEHVSAEMRAASALAASAALVRNTDNASMADFELLAKLELSRRYHARRVAADILQGVGRYVLRGAKIKAGKGIVEVKNDKVILQDLPQRRMVVERFQPLRLVGCGYRLTDRMKGVGIWQRPDRERGRLSGICLCGSSWTCPVCSPRISAGRVGEVQECAEKAAKRGFLPLMETRSLPHSASDSPELLLRHLQEMKRRSEGGRRGQSLRAHRIGYIDGGEMTWGDNGPHPHIHRLSFVEAMADGMDETGNAKFKPWSLYDDYAARCAWIDQIKRIGRYKDSVLGHSFDVVLLNSKSTQYISKIGLEIASSALATKDSLTPLGMVFRLVDGTLDRDPWAARFRQSAEALNVTKFAALRFSNGLRKEFGLSKEKTDDELAAEESTEMDVLLGYLDEFQWEHIRRERLDVALQYVANKGSDAVDHFLSAHGLGYLRRERGEVVQANVEFTEEVASESNEIEEVIYTPSEFYGDREA